MGEEGCSESLARECVRAGQNRNRTQSHLAVFGLLIRWTPLKCDDGLPDGSAIEDRPKEGRQAVRQAVRQAGRQERCDVSKKM